jgi:plasmid stabilization system protein ParE
VRLLFTEAAVADLERLRDFIRRHHPAAANRARDRIVGTAERLTAFPSEGRSVRGREDIREIPLAFGESGYLLRYQVTRDAVIVLRIWHAREDREEP